MLSNLKAGEHADKPSSMDEQNIFQLVKRHQELITHSRTAPLRGRRDHRSPI